MKNLRIAKWVLISAILLGLKLAVAGVFLCHGQSVSDTQLLAPQAQFEDQDWLEGFPTSDLPRAPRVASRTSTSVKPVDVSPSGEIFYTSSFADHAHDGDATGGEDPVVRHAAIAALGNMNGTVLAIDPASGRILAMVNQKLALSGGAEPCSTIKVSVALAALSEGIITKESQVTLESGNHMSLTNAIARSNNQYFEAVGRQLGFDKVRSYAHQFGLGELAGINISGEQSGVYPAHEISAKLGGVGRMCSFGEGISMTPLQLGALIAAIANGGTLYYLQHPSSPDDVVNFRPSVKRQLEIGRLIDQISDGLAGAVNYGTARRVRYSFTQEQVLGKTGTCSQAGTRFGWFGSFANTSVGRIVVVVFLEGGHLTSGPKAAEVAGRVYRRLYNHQYFQAKSTPLAISASATPGPATK